MQRLPVTRAVLSAMTISVPSNARFDNVGAIDFPASEGCESLWGCRSKTMPALK